MKVRGMGVFASLWLLLGAPASEASVHGWIGPSVGGLWSSPANWTGGVPTSSEGGMFGTQIDFGANIQSTNDIAGLVVNGIYFDGTGNVISGTTPITFGPPASLGANLRNEVGANTLASSLSINLTGDLVDYVKSGSITIAGAIGGNGGIEHTALLTSGTLSLTGHNSYSGTTSVIHGTLTLDSLTGGAIPGPSIIGDGSGAAGSAVVKLLRGSQIDGNLVTIAPDGLLDLNGSSEAFGGLVSIGGPGSTATVKLNGGGLGVGTSPGTFLFDGVINGPVGALMKNGPSTLALSGSNTFTGPTTVQGGTLIVNGSQSSSPINVLNTAKL
ncbi:MAG TPA: autotransporter-associated beta strand repeat-containing protein, partial [Thermoanaerobaculia bacterium]|nr:autotransporter-associated beta strand repeat-containing protein [Thermoanaerobaculia bacterium]